MAERTHPLTLARIARGMTGVDLAQAVRDAAARRGFRSGTDKQRVRKWEAEDVTPDHDSQVYIAEALGLPAQAVDQAPWPHWLPDAGVIPLGPDSTATALREALRTTMNRSRRTVLTAISSAALITLAGDWAETDAWAQVAERNEGLAVGDDLVALLEDVSARLTVQATEQRQHTAPMLDSVLTTVTNLLTDCRCTSSVRVRLHALAASLSQTVAWHRFDNGWHAEATRYWVAGLHSAHEGGDRDMGAALLGDLAYQASWRRDASSAAEILERALSRTHHPVAQSLLQLRLARALAAQGERRGTLRALAAAEHLLGVAGSTGHPVPAWCSWFSEADLAVDSGQSLLDLGDTRRAHQLISEGQDLLPHSRDKTRGVFLAYTAQSHLDLGEPDLAAAAAMDSLDLAERIGAPRCVQLIQDLVPRFETYRTAQGVPQLLTRAA